MSGSRSHSEKKSGKSSQNSATLVLIFRVVYILFVHTLLKVVSRYDLSVLSMSVIGFQKNTYMGLVYGWSEVLIFFWDFWNLFNFAKRLSNHTSVLPRLLLQGAAPCPLFLTPCPFEKAEMTPCPFD